MSISFSATTPVSGTFLNPLPTVRTREGSHVDAGTSDDGEKSNNPQALGQVNIDVIYQTVANRRLAFDNMTWQVPIMALTAHAFLFTIALAGDSTPLARYLSMIIVLIITLLTCRLFIGHMIREVSDRAWLEEFEKAYLPQIAQVHVKHWRFRKVANKNKAGWMKFLFVLPAFQTWRDGLVLIGGMAIAVIIVTGVKPELLANDGSASRRI
ncbi:hypothetical protein BKA62DRAFT_697216 [Auriculariales sp. MPI-PUGE-AT-0066]|nr:hypothetical protein BKA62DRAFT_697216 [Auriculariales sp. MPI-PUGE-AT-0066]